VNDEVYTAPAYSRNGYLGAFVQDDWKLTRKLTVNVGLRWDMFIPDYPLYGQKSWIDYALPNPGAPGEDGALAFATSSPLRSGAGAGMASVAATRVWGAGCEWACQPEAIARKTKANPTGLNHVPCSARVEFKNLTCGS